MAFSINGSYPYNLQKVNRPIFNDTIFESEIKTQRYYR